MSLHPSLPVGHVFGARHYGPVGRPSCPGATTRPGTKVQHRSTHVIVSTGPRHCR